MKSSHALIVLFAAATLLVGCNPASDFADPEVANSTAGNHTPLLDNEVRSVQASCPCFSLSNLSDTDRKLAADGRPASDYYLFFDVFDYYELDPRRTEARALVSTSAGLFEEVASVYITRGSGDERFLVCHRQDVVQDPVSGDPTYRYETLSPTLEQAEACRQTIYTAVSEQEPCQGPACGMAYTKEQLDPAYPLYQDDNYRAPEALLNRLRQQVENVGRMLRQPS